MNILILVWQVFDVEVCVKVVGSGVDFEGVILVVDGMDEYGVEEVLRLCEGGVFVDIIIVLVVGLQCNEDVLCIVLVMGVDCVIYVEIDEKIDVVSFSKIVVQVVQVENVGLILVGG